MKINIVKLKMKLLELAAKSLYKDLPPESRVKVYIGQDAKVIVSGYNSFPLDQKKLFAVGMREW